MSASIYWKPIENSAGSIDCWAPSRFVETMRLAFGEPPWRLGPDAVQTLRGMDAACMDDKRSPYAQIIEKITNDGEPRIIEAWPEY